MDVIERRLMLKVKTTGRKNRRHDLAFSHWGLWEVWILRVRPQIGSGIKGYWKGYQNTHAHNTYSLSRALSLSVSLYLCLSLSLTHTPRGQLGCLSTVIKKVQSEEHELVQTRSNSILYRDFFYVCTIQSAHFRPIPFRGAELNLMECL